MISVCVPTYNRAVYLPEMIESVLAQTYPDWELVIWDDGSTDSTEKILSYYHKKDPRIVVGKGVNKGIAAARNQAIALSRGEYIAVMDSDDIMSPERLKVSLKLITKKGVDFIYGAYLRADERAQVFDGQLPPVSVTKENILANNSAPHVTIMAKRQCFLEHPYDDRFVVNDDAKLLCDWYKAGYSSAYTKDPLVIVRYHSASVSSTRDKEVRKSEELIRKELDHA